MRKAARLFKEVDILVTAGSSWRIKEISSSGEIRKVPDPGPDSDWDPDHPNPLNTIYSQLKALMLKRDKKGYNRLLKAGTVADMFWQPLTFNGPVEFETKVQAMTLSPLKRIPDFIDRGKKVLFVLGPYEGGFHKGDVLLAALGAEADPGYSFPPLFTHLVCDYRTARAVLRRVQRLSPQLPSSWATAPSTPRRSSGRELARRRHPRPGSYEPLRTADRPRRCHRVYLRRSRGTQGRP